MKKPTFFLYSVLFLLALNTLIFTRVEAQSGDDNQDYKMHQSLMSKYGFMDLPGLILTGDAEIDAATYERIKTQWISDNPEKYHNLSGTPETAFLSVNDLCAGALSISCGSTVSGTTADGNTFDNAGFCVTTNTSAGVWYTITGTGEVVELTTCNAGTNYDTKISVFSGSCNSLVCVTGNDDDFSCPISIFHSTVSFLSTISETYYVLVHGFGSGVGNFELSMTCTPCPTNDQPCNAIPLVINGNTPYDNRCATADLNEVSPGSGTEATTCNSQDGWCSFEVAVQNSIWFTFTAPATGCLQLNIDNNADLQFAVWEVTDCGDYSTFTEVAANDDGGEGLSPQLIINDKDAGLCLLYEREYYLQVDGFNGNQSNGNIVTALDAEGLNCCQIPIPTLSEWGIIILGLFMLCLGLVFILNRKRIFSHE